MDIISYNELSSRCADGSGTSKAGHGLGKHSAFLRNGGRIWLGGTQTIEAEQLERPCLPVLLRAADKILAQV